MRRALPIATALAMAALAAPAHAANVSVHDGVATYSAGATGDNDLAIKPHPNGAVFEEETETIHAGDGCSSINSSAVLCNSVGFTSIRALMGVADNVVVVTADFPTVIDGQGADENRFFGGPQVDVLIGGDRADTLSGGDGPDDLNGNGGDDRLSGGAGEDELYGGGQSDRLIGGGGADHFDGGIGHDIVDYTERASRVVVTIDNLANDGAPVFGTEGDDVRTTNEVVIGGGVDDVLTGSDGYDTLSGGPGDDLIRGGGGPDALRGDDGVDTVSYSDHTMPVRVDFDPVIGDDGAEGESDDLFGFENVQGGQGDDTLIGDGGPNLLRGGFGSDTLEGLAGQDRLEGESGGDTLRSDDGEADVDDCGEGTDTALADSFDTREGCELPQEQPPVEQPPVGQPPVEPPPVQPAVVVKPRKPSADRRGYVRVKVSCPATAPARCAGTLRLRRGTRTYGKARFSIAPGSTKTLRVKVKSSLRRSLGRRRLNVAAG